MGRECVGRIESTQNRVSSELPHVHYINVMLFRSDTFSNSVNTISSHQKNRLWMEFGALSENGLVVSFSGTSISSSTRMPMRERV